VAKIKRKKSSIRKVLIILFGHLWVEELSGAWGKMIHEKNVMQQISPDTIPSNLD
jgi:hypothetical protein